MAVSKRLRYEIFRRDNHACRYCGAAAPEVKLTVDHVTPVALGGTDHPSNLVAACTDCNSGKSSATPDATLIDDVRADSELWAKAKDAAVEGRRADKLVGFEAEIVAFDEAWGHWTYPDGDRRLAVPRSADWKVSVRLWLLRDLPVARLIELVPVAMERPGVDLEDRWRYFCGCAWRAVANFDAAVEAEFAVQRALAGAREQVAAERSARAERIVASGALVPSLLRVCGEHTPVTELDPIADRLLRMVLPHVRPADGSEANSDAVLVADLRAAIGLCCAESQEDLSDAAALWFLADAGLDPESAGMRC